MVTFLKLLQTSIDETAGKIINAEIKSVPTRFIASTIITAITLANESDSESIVYVADLLDSIAEDCTYLAEELDKQ